MTCLPTEEGWLYLATAIDVATREVVGYAMGAQPQGGTSLVAA
ncbi:hypothetical protein ACIGXI_34280 [Kitasatospora aureofaciens]